MPNPRGLCKSLSLFMEFVQEIDRGSARPQGCGGFNRFAHSAGPHRLVGGLLVDWLLFCFVTVLLSCWVATYSLG